MIFTSIFDDGYLCDFANGSSVEEKRDHKDILGRPKHNMGSDVIT